MKILVCGGRYFDNYAFLEKILNDIHKDTPITMLINGDADGADWLSTKWAKANLRYDQLKRYPANWYPKELAGKLDRGAGPKRNAWMLIKNPDIELCVAFEGGTGTADMVRKATEKGIKILEPTA